MLYMIHMVVNLPPDMDPEKAAQLKSTEKAYSQGLQRNGSWRHLWRVTGEYANISIFDVASNDELHTLLSGLPLFPYSTIKVTPLSAHPSAI